MAKIPKKIKKSFVKLTEEQLDRICKHLNLETQISFNKVQEEKDNKRSDIFGCNKLRIEFTALPSRKSMKTLIENDVDTFDLMNVNKEYYETLLDALKYVENSIKTKIKTMEQ